MSNILDRIYQFIDYKKIKISEFSKAVEVSSGYFSKQKANNANIGSQIIEKIVRNYPEVNPRWLITGEGNMLLDFSLGITGGEKTEVDKEFNAIRDNMILLSKLITANQEIETVSNSYENIFGRITVLEGYLSHYALTSSMDSALDSYRINKIKIYNLLDEFKINSTRLKELHDIIIPYKDIIQELYKKVSDFDLKHDNIYQIAPEKEKKYEE